MNIQINPYFVVTGPLLTLTRTSRVRIARPVSLNAKRILRTFHHPLAVAQTFLSNDTKARRRTPRGGAVPIRTRGRTRIARTLPTLDRGGK